MVRWISGVVLGMGLSMSTAWAEKDRYDVGEVVPTFTLKAVNGEDVGDAYISIDRYYGAGAKEPKKAILLSFFATYCDPCKREMPLLAALYDTYKSKGLQVVMVSIDKENDKVDVAKTLAKDNGVKFPVLTDRFNIVAKRYFVSKLPNVYLLNADGKVTMVNVGYNEDISRKLVEEIRKAVGDPVSDPLPEAIAKHMTHAGGGAESVPVQDAAPAGGGATATTADAGTAGAATAPADADEDQDDKPGKGKGKQKGKQKGKKKGK